MTPSTEPQSKKADPHFKQSSEKVTDGIEPTFSFKPASEGLGFHPFSDGLPYTSASQRRNLPPSGLVTARTKKSLDKESATQRLQKALQFDPAAVKRGQPVLPKSTGLQKQTFATPSLPVSSPLSQKPFPNFKPVHSTPDANSDFSITIDGDPMGPISRTDAAFENVNKFNVKSPVSAVEPALETKHGPFLSSRLSRTFAYLLDFFIHGGLAVLGVGSLLWLERIPKATMLEPEIIAICVGFVALFHWALTAAQEIAFGSTLGKRTFGISFEARPEKIFLRAILFIPSLLLGGFGLLWSFLDSDHYCLHDRLSGVFPKKNPHA